MKELFPQDSSDPSIEIEDQCLCLKHNQFIKKLNLIPFITINSSNWPTQLNETIFKDLGSN